MPQAIQSDYSVSDSAAPATVAELCWLVVQGDQRIAKCRSKKLATGEEAAHDFGLPRLGKARGSQISHEPLNLMGKGSVARELEGNLVKTQWFILNQSTILGKFDDVFSEASCPGK